MKCVVVLLVAFSLAFACQSNFNFNQDPHEWPENGLWKTNVYIKLKNHLQLKDWTLRLEFYDPLARDIEVASDKSGNVGTASQTVVNLSPLAPRTSRYLHAGVVIWYRATFASQQSTRGHLKCAQFCGQRTDTGAEICGENVIMITSSTPDTTKAATTKQPDTTTKQPDTTTQGNSIKANNSTQHTETHKLKKKNEHRNIK